MVNPEPLTSMEVMTATMELPAAMPRTADAHNSFAGGRDPAHELYDHAAGLLATAHALEAATLPSESVAAIVPTLSCIETSLVALNGAVEGLRRLALQRLTAPVLTAEDLRPLRADVSLRMERLAGILEQCSLECAAAREALDPAADELTAV
jgi:hypothetical protein